MSDNNINSELKNILEAALLVAGQPLTLERMLAMFPAESQPTKDELREVLAHIEQDYAARGVELKQIGKGWRIQTREKYTEFVAKLLEERPPRYSRALLETLAIIAYRQPVTRGEIEEIRGVAVSTEIIRTLVERSWVKQVGVREVPGRPAIYGTTPAFLEHFNLKSLDDMPALAELRSIEEISADLDRRVSEAEAANNPGPNGANSPDGANGAGDAVDAGVQAATVENVAEDTAAETFAEKTALAEAASDTVAAITEPESSMVVETQPDGANGAGDVVDTGVQVATVENVAEDTSAETFAEETALAEAASDAVAAITEPESSQVVEAQSADRE